MKLGVYTPHVRSYSGTDHFSLRLIKYLQEKYDLQLQLGNSYTIDCKTAFNFDTPRAKVYARLINPDVFLSLSASYLVTPNGKKNVAYVFTPHILPGLSAYQTVVVPSHFVKSAIRHYYKGEIRVIPPGIDTKQYLMIEKKKSIVSVGGFFEGKNRNNKRHDFLIEAFKKLYEKDKEWELNLVGFILDRTYYDYIREQAGDLPIKFYNGIPFELLRKLYAQASVYWSATGFDAKETGEHESFSLSILEAMASGAQPIAYVSGGLSDIEGIESWQTIDELVDKTINYKVDVKRLESLREMAGNYDISKTFDLWDSVLSVE